MRVSQTSKEAYLNKKPTISSDQEKILSKMDENKGFTYNELSDMLGWTNPNKVSRRMSELVRKNKVKIKEVRKCNIAKSNCNSYVKIN